MERVFTTLRAMIPYTCSLLLFSLFLGPVNVQADQTSVVRKAPVPTEDYLHSMSLEETGHYFLFWKFDSESITFEVHARTFGWVGFGLSHNGGMKGSDIVIGWVKEGKAFFKDRHAVGNELPPVDKSQDYELLDAKETLTYTVLKFRRKLEICDTDDYVLDEGTVRLIFSWGEKDPDSHDTVAYHGPGRRGTKSVMLLDYGRPDEKIRQDYKTMPFFDVRINNATLRTNRTTYMCRILPLPQLNGKKHHVVQVDPLIDPKNTAVVHHVVLYLCHGKLREEQEPRVCWEGNMPDNATACDTVMMGWAVGQKDFHYPKEAGFPIGEAGEPKFVHIEMHYDNPEGLEGIVDNSGLRLYYTDQLRPYDAGTLMLGHTVYWPPLAIPPGAENFHVTTHCTTSCTSKVIPKSGINVFAVLLHTHLVGKAIWTKHYRDGNELPEMAREDHYDFNYQQFRVLKKEVNVKPGDELLTTCVYDTKKRKKFTLGGPGTDNEMCINFAFYYPRIGLSACASTNQEFYPIYQYVMNKAMVGDIAIRPQADDMKNMYDHLNKIKWSKTEIDEFQALLDKSQGFRQYCSVPKGGTNVFGSNSYKYVKKTEYKTKYQKPSKCRVTASSASGVHLSVILVAMATLLAMFR